MNRTTLAPQMALVAVGARPCDGLGPGYPWGSAVMSDANGSFANETTIKRPARRLGRLLT
jgi:hypothetical protein